MSIEAFRLILWDSLMYNFWKKLLMTLAETVFILTLFSTVTALSSLINIWATVVYFARLDTIWIIEFNLVPFERWVNTFPAFVRRKFLVVISVVCSFVEFLTNKRTTIKIIQSTNDLKKIKVFDERFWSFVVVRWLLWLWSSVLSCKLKIWCWAFLMRSNSCRFDKWSKKSIRVAKRWNNFHKKKFLLAKTLSSFGEYHIFYKQKKKKNTHLMKAKRFSMKS